MESKKDFTNTGFTDSFTSEIQKKQNTSLILKNMFKSN